MKLWIIHLLDWIDENILFHRFYWVCQKIGLSKWWGEEDCPCSYCVRHRQYSSEITQGGNNEQKN